MARASGSGGGATGAAWLRLIRGLSAGKSRPSIQRRASITGGGKVTARLWLIGRIGASPGVGRIGPAFIFPKIRPPEACEFSLENSHLLDGGQGLRTEFRRPCRCRRH